MEFPILINLISPFSFKGKLRDVCSNPYICNRSVDSLDYIRDFSPYGKQRKLREECSKPNME